MATSRNDWYWSNSRMIIILKIIIANLLTNMSERIADLSTFSCPILCHVSKFIVPGLKKESLILFLHELNFFFLNIKKIERKLSLTSSLILAALGIPWISPKLIFSLRLLCSSKISCLSWQDTWSDSTNKSITYQQDLILYIRNFFISYEIIFVSEKSQDVKIYNNDIMLKWYSKIDEESEFRIFPFLNVNLCRKFSTN